MDSVDHARRCRAVGEVAYADDTGEALREWREAHGVSQTDLAGELDVSCSVVSDYESGRRSPGLEFVARYVAGVVAVARGDSDAADGRSARQSLRGGNAERRTYPNTRDGILETIRTLQDEYENS